MDKLVKVAIVGAGVSGLKAAETLISSGKIGKDEIVVLEAQDHVGGRIQDSSIGQSKLEVAYALGAMWYHDSLVNSVLYELLESGLLKMTMFTMTTKTVQRIQAMDFWICQACK